MRSAALLSLSVSMARSYSALALSRILIGHPPRRADRRDGPTPGECAGFQNRTLSTTFYDAEDAANNATSEPPLPPLKSFAFAATKLAHPAPSFDYSGRIFWLWRNTLSGSYLRLIFARRAYFSAPNAALTRFWPSSPRKFTYTDPFE